MPPVTLDFGTIGRTLTPWVMGLLGLVMMFSPLFMDELQRHKMSFIAIIGGIMLIAGGTPLANAFWPAAP